MLGAGKGNATTAAIQLSGRTGLCTIHSVGASLPQRKDQAEPQVPFHWVCHQPPSNSHLNTCSEAKQWDKLNQLLTVGTDAL